jgi:purine-nucleoside phosphorylase
MTVDQYKVQVEEAVQFLQSRLPVQPEILIQLGTGLGELAEAMEDVCVIPYADIPHFPESTVQSHAGNLVSGRLGGKSVALLQGRFHYYEGYTTREVAFPVRVLSLLGAHIAIITNASGGLNQEYSPGTLMVVSDHIYLIPENPLRGPNVDAWGERFPDLSEPYEKSLQQLALATAKDLGLDEVVSGTYVCIPGPSLETPAETRHLRMKGADAVGMSSVPEVLVAIHAGMRVLGVSVVANVNDPDNFEPILLPDIVAAAERAEPRLLQLVMKTIERI